MSCKQDYRIVAELAFFDYGSDYFFIGIAKNIKWNKYYVYIKHLYCYTDYVWNDYNYHPENYKTIENMVYLTLSAATELVNLLEPVYLGALSFIEIDKGSINCYSIYI